MMRNDWNGFPASRCRKTSESRQVSKRRSYEKQQRERKPY
jgi:hypothetical protein